MNPAGRSGGPGSPAPPVYGTLAGAGVVVIDGQIVPTQPSLVSQTIPFTGSTPWRFPSDSWADAAGVVQGGAASNPAAVTADPAKRAAAVVMLGGAVISSEIAVEGATSGTVDYIGFVTADGWLYTFDISGAVPVAMPSFWQANLRPKAPVSAAIGDDVKVRVAGTLNAAVTRNVGTLGADLPTRVPFSIDWGDGTPATPVPVGTMPFSFEAIGGVVTTPGDGYRYHTLAERDLFQVTGTGDVVAEVLLVGGGGDGGGIPIRNQQWAGGGGGGGEVLVRSMTLAAGSTHRVVGVRSGRTGPRESLGIVGGTIAFNGVTAKGGGAAAAASGAPNEGGAYTGPGLVGTNHNGGAGTDLDRKGHANGGGGGAGAGGDGTDATPGQSGDGGPGVEWPVGSGNSYGGGGGGGGGDPHLRSGSLPRVEPGAGGIGGGAPGRDNTGPYTDKPTGEMQYVHQGILEKPRPGSGGGGGGAYGKSSSGSGTAHRGTHGATGGVIVRYIYKPLSATEFVHQYAADGHYDIKVRDPHGVFGMFDTIPVEIGSALKPQYVYVYDTASGQFDQGRVRVWDKAGGQWDEGRVAVDDPDDGWIK
jgi:hypothetical protein